MLAIAIVFIPITVIGIFGNILVLLVIALNTQMHDRLAKKFFKIFKIKSLRFFNSYVKAKLKNRNKKKFLVFWVRFDSGPITL